MDNSFPYSTDAQSLQKNFYPFPSDFKCLPRRTNNKYHVNDIEIPTYRDIDPLYIPPVCRRQIPELANDPDMNTPKFPDSIFASTEYGDNYNLSAPTIKTYSPSHKIGFYMNVFGRPAKTTLNFPYILQVYTPKPFEDKFQTKESALTRAPNFGEWQIVNVFTGQHIYSPRRVNNHSYYCE